MSLAIDVAVGAAEQLERSAGPAAGLAVWRRLATNAAGAELRGRAILGGLRCAIAVQDLTAIRDLGYLWQTVDEGVWTGIFTTCREMRRAGLGACAIDLAYAEVRRLRTAHALYMVARCLDVAGDPRAPGAFAEALERAEKEGAPQLAHASRVRRAAWLARSAETVADAIEEAKRVDVGVASPAERLVLARILLRAPSRFTRASGIGLLDELVTRGATRLAADVLLARRALTLAATHADDMADDLTSLEADRLLALFSREPIAMEAARVRDAIRALERIARAKEKKSEAELAAALDAAGLVDPELTILHERARDILRGRFEAHLEGTSEASQPVVVSSAYPIWTSLLDAVVAMRDAAWPRAAHALSRLAEAADRGGRMPAALWTVAQAALGTDDAELRGIAGRLVVAMMKTTNAAPPRGWLGLAQALAASGMDEPATTARRCAALAREPGASEALGLALTRSGWQLAGAGERSLAIARLREARALAAGHRPEAEPPREPAGAPPPRDPGASPST